jgi:hypothetical protein
MTENPSAPDVVDDGVTDVLAENEVVHVPAAVIDLAEGMEHHGDTFVTDVPEWDETDH